MLARRLSAAIVAAMALGWAEAPGPGAPVYLETDAAAARLYAEALVAEREGRWPEAVDAWSRLASRHPSALCEVEPGHWRCAEDLACERFRSLPPDLAGLARAAHHAEPLPSARRALECGRWAAALRALARDPAPTPQAVLLAARAALALGDGARVAALAERAEATPSMVSIGGREMGLAEALNALLARAQVPVGTAGWPATPPVRDVSSLEGPLVCWKEVDLAPPRRRSEEDLRDRVLAAQLSSGGAPAFAPAVDGGLLVLRDAESVLALDLADGRTRWRHLDSPVHCPVHLCAGRISGRPACSFWGPVVCGGRVFLASESDRGKAGLRVLSLDDGAVLRDVMPIEGATLAAAPLPVGEVVFLLVATLGAEEQYHIAAVGASTGRTLWTSFVYAQLGGPSHLFDWALGASSIGTLAEAGGVVFIGSNAGVVAAVDRSDGRVLWARRYDAVPPAEARVAVDDERSGWGANPVLIHGDGLLVAPMDGESLLVVRRADGALLGQVPRRGRRALLGAMGDLAYVAGAEVACVDLSTGEDRWLRPIEGRGFGRGFLTPSGVYHATDRALVCLRPEDGQLVWGPCTWPAAGAGDGTLLPAGEGMLCASGTRLTLAVPRRVYDRDMAPRLGRAPDDGDLLLARGEAYEKAGYEEEALADYLAVAAREAGSDRARRARERSYRLLSGRADRLARGGRLQESLAAWRESLDVADEGASAVTARASIAELLERTGDLAGALSAWQEVLDRHPREVLTEGDVRRSGRVRARGRIASLRVRLGLPPIAATPSAMRPAAMGEAPAWHLLAERPPVCADGGWPWADIAGEPVGEDAESVSLLPVPGEIVLRRGRTIACIEPGRSEVRWMSRLAHEADPLVRRAGDVLLFQEPGRVASVDRASGKVRWEAESPAGEPLGGPWAHAERTLVAIATRGGAVLLSCVDANGRTTWDTAIPGSATTGVALDGETMVLLDRESRRLTVVGIEAGTEEWTRSGPGLLAAGDSLDGWGLAGGCVVVLSGGSRLAAWDLGTGEAAWEARAPAPVRAFAPAEAGIAAALAGGRVLIFDPASGRVLYDRTLGIESSAASWFGSELGVAGTKDDHARIVRLRPGADGDFAEVPGVDLGEGLDVAGFVLLPECALVESPCGEAIDAAATLTAFRLGGGEVLWQQTFPLATGERLVWCLVEGALVEESHGVVRTFAPLDVR